MKQFEQVRGKLIDMLEDLDVSLGDIAEDPQSIDHAKKRVENNVANHAGSFASTKVVNTNSDQNSYQNRQNLSHYQCSLCSKPIDLVANANQSQMLICSDCKKIMKGD
ncbi:MAG: hypothetical protein V3U75_06670 [Methylococcaceae bacterium]